MSPLRLGILGSSPDSLAVRACVATRDDIDLAGDISGPVDAPHLDAALAFLDPGRLDAVMISADRRTAPGLIITALQRGLHVLTVTMPARTLEDMIEIRRAEANAPGLCLKFSFAHRYHQSVCAALALVRTGELGELVSVRGVHGVAADPAGLAPWQRRFDLCGGGTLFDQGMVMLDLMHLFAGPFEELKSIMDARVWTGHGLEDNVMAVMRTNAGVLASLHASTTQWRPTFRLELGYENGFLWLDGLLSETIDYGPEVLVVGRLARDARGNAIARPQEQVHRFETDTSALAALDDFVGAIAAGKPFKAGSSMQAFDAMNAVQRLYADDPTFLHAPA